MTGTENVLAVVDGSHQDDAVLDWAAAEARRLDTALTVVQLADVEPADGWVPAEARAEDRRQEQAVLSAAVSRVRVGGAGLRVTAMRVKGDPVTGLLPLVDRSRLAVLGGEGRRNPAGGSRAAIVRGVALRAHRPVVVVRGRRRPSGPVVAGVAGDASDEAVLREAFACAQRRGVPLRVLHGCRGTVVDVSCTIPPYAPEPAIEAMLTALVRRSGRACPEVSAETAVLHGRPARLLREVSAGSSLVVVGATRPRAVRLPGRVCRSLFRRAWCPVVVVH